MKVHNVIVHEEKNLSDAVKERMVHATFLENSLNKDTLLCMTSNVEQYLVQFHLQHITKVLIKMLPEWSTWYDFLTSHFWTNLNVKNRLNEWQHVYEMARICVSSKTCSREWQGGSIG